MSDIKICVFDNPTTDAREQWINGRLDLSITFNYLYQKPRAKLPDPGHLTGSISALPQELIHHVRWIRRVK